jgi:hypothetical protein
MWSALAFALAWSLSDGMPVLDSRTLDVPPFVVPGVVVNFDLYDVRFEPSSTPAEKAETHSIFRLRRHLGLAAGYDQGVLHGSLGLYVTVAEIGRWNLGVTSPAIGLSRYQRFDPRLGRSVAKTETTILVSLASVHFRAGYLRSLDKYWYVNIEQVFDAVANINGSQIGISFSGR